MKKRRTILHYAYSLLSARGGGDGNITRGAFSRLRSAPSLGGIWGRRVEDVGKPSSRLALGFGPCGSLASRGSLEVPRGHEEIPSY